MEASKSPNYWVFSNRPEGGMDNSIWDQATFNKTDRYAIKQREGNRKHVRPGDTVYLRIYGQAFVGKCTVAGEWERASPEDEEQSGRAFGTFPMKDIEHWARPLPQALIMGDLSNQNHRRRIVRITREDGLMIEAAQRVYARLGFGRGDDDVLLLEKGLEEAIKPNLKRLGLRLAGKAIQQQFSMGIGVGRSDLICLDEDGDLVVVELKRGMTSDQAVGQVMRYVGWLRENVAEEGQKVHGCIVVGDYDEHLRWAAAAANVRLVLVRLG